MAILYESKYSKIPGKQIKPAQKIVELICERFYLKNGISLPKAFWNDPAYSRDYKLQLIRANALLKVYSAEAIVGALLGPAKNVWSLGAKWLDGLIAAEQKKIDINNRKREEYKLQEEDKETNWPPKTVDDLAGLMGMGGKKKESLLDKLDG